jgi:hypothetical protein
MVKLNQLSKEQRIGITTLRLWLEQFDKDTDVRIHSNLKPVSTLITTINKIILLSQYTEDERDILNELRTKYKKNQLDEY